MPYVKLSRLAKSEKKSVVLVYWPQFPKGHPQMYRDKPWDKRRIRKRQCILGGAQALTGSEKDSDEMGKTGTGMLRTGIRTESAEAYH